MKRHLFILKIRWRLKLYQTENRKISKICFLCSLSVKPLLNGKMEVHMNNGEVQIVNRHYLKDFKSKFGL